MQGGVEELSVEELASNLSTYKEQLEQVRRLLDDEPGNSEYEDMEKELAEVISLTEELLETSREHKPITCINISNRNYTNKERVYGIEVEIWA